MKHTLRSLVGLLLICAIGACVHAQTVPVALQPGVISTIDRTNRTGNSGTDPLYDTHASTIVECANHDLLIAYFNGGFEGANNQCIYVSRRAWNGSAWGASWGAPLLVAGTPYPGASFTTNSGVAMYNPVLFQPTGGPLFLYYKQLQSNAGPATWKGWYKTSTDNGLTWSAAVALPTNYAGYSANAPYGNVLGPVRCKPLQLPSGVVLFGSSLEQTSYQAYIQRSTNVANPFGSGNWTTSPGIDSAALSIQPTFLYHGGSTIQVLTRRSPGTAPTYIGQSWSFDNGLNWTNVVPTAMPNNWSGIEGQLLADGRSMLFYNHANRTATTDGRYTLNGAVSGDGQQWHAAVELETSAQGLAYRFDYPTAIQDSTGKVQVAYTNNHIGVRNVTLDPGPLKGLPLNTSSATLWQWPVRFIDLVNSPAYANLTEDSASANSGYISAGSSGAGNAFGYQTTQRAAGYAAGEIGGVFARTAPGVSYFGRSIGGTHTRSSSLIATGQVWKNPGASGASTHLYLGFFESGATGASNFLGLDLSGSGAVANILDSAGGNAASATGEASQAPANAAPYQYSIIWSPTANSGAGQLSVTLVSGAGVRIDWTLSGAPVGPFTGAFSVDSFGLFSVGDGGSGSIEAYLDNIAVGAAGVGACCSADGTCSANDAAGCTANYVGNGSVCTPNPCAQPQSGVCCQSDGSCTAATPGIPNAACPMGTLIVGGTCAPNACAQPQVGICCQSDGSCTVATPGNATGTNTAVCSTGTLTVSGSCSPNTCPPPATGVCCRGATCNSTVVQAECTAPAPTGASFVSSTTACNIGGTTTTPCCYADYNKNGVLAVQDIFDFLNDWFAGSPFAHVGGDGNPSGLAVSDIFAFLNAWFTGC